MSRDAVFAMVAAAAFLAIALVAVFRGKGNVMAAPLGLMASLLFAYNLLDAGDDTWTGPAYAAAALLAIPTLDLTTTFVGARERTRWPRRLFTAYFAALALATPAAFIQPPTSPLWRGDTWALCMLAGLVPGVGGAAVLLVQHVRRASGKERARGRLLGGAMLLGVGGSTVDLAFIASGSALRVGALPLVVAAALIAALVLRARFIEGLSALTVTTAAVVASLAVIAQLAVYTVLGTRPALLVMGTTSVVVVLAAVLRPLLQTLAEQRARMRYLATLGRIAEQMAHDVRNPLAAIRGAAQLLQSDHAAGRSLSDRVEFLDLIVERSDHLAQVVHRYQRMGRVEPAMERVALNELVKRAVQGIRVSGHDLNVDLQLEPELPPVHADPDLLGVAIENVLRNAVEAMPDGGELAVHTARGRLDERTAVRVTVRDTGVGMDARTRERAFDDFFTTKAQGTGLGLPYLARVCEAHGGTASITSEAGVGTTVEMVLPAERAR